MAKLNYIQPQEDVAPTPLSSHTINSNPEITDLNAVMARIGEASVVLLDPSLPRERITQALITEKGFNIVAIDQDWAQAARTDHYIRHAEYKPSASAQAVDTPELQGLITWLHKTNEARKLNDRIAFHGLDLYNSASARSSVLNDLDATAPKAAAIAHQRFDALLSGHSDNAIDDLAPPAGVYLVQEARIRNMLVAALDAHRRNAEHDSEKFLDAGQTVKLFADAPTYYRALYYSLNEVRGLRDAHMFETLQALLKHYKRGSKIVVWTHAAPITANASDDGSYEHTPTLGNLCRDAYDSNACVIDPA